MRFAFLFFLLTAPLFLSAQRGDVPTENPNNELELKVVFQEYTIVTSTRYGSSSEESEYLNLKVNNMYMPKGITGIHSKYFKRYLTNCPEALDLSMNGLSMYNKEGRNYMYGNLSWLAGFGAGGYILYNNRNDFSKNNLIAGLSAAAGGMLVSYLFRKRAKNFKHKGDDIIVNAFDVYANSCYKPSDNPTGQTSQSSNSKVENGDNNDNEELLIDLVSNNASSRYIALNFLGSISMRDAVAVHYGPELSLFKNGIYINAHAHLTRSLEDNISSIEDRELGYSARVAIPFFPRKSKLKKTHLNLGNMQGLQAMGVSETIPTEVHKAFTVDLGIEHYRLNNGQFSSETNDYFVKSTLLRGGIGHSWFSNLSYKINDNRFSANTRHSAMLGRLYVDAVYNYKTEYQIVPSLFGEDPVLESEIGWAVGADIRFSNYRFAGLSMNLEGGKFPIVNSINGWAARFRLGVGLYSVNRSKPVE